MNKMIVFLLPMLLSACSGLNGNDSGDDKAKSNTNFYQHWIHSYEEQGGAKIPNIFRPEGSRQFPASRFRMEFGFDPNGQCNYKYLSPTDRHEMRSCIYTKIGNQVFIYDDAGKLLPQISFTLLESASSDRMRITYGVPTVQSKKAKKK